MAAEEKNMRRTRRIQDKGKNNESSDLEITGIKTAGQREQRQNSNMRGVSGQKTSTSPN